jgi:guanylate kinase
MAERKAGIIVILSSPSGAGKTTLVKKISSRNNFKISISHTTRKPRINEKDGKHYFFVKDKKFKKLIKQKKFLEYAKVFKNYYGSLKENVVEKLEKSENVIFDIDWQGTQQIKNIKLKYKIITIFILPPSKEELFNRLLKRDKKDQRIASERMKQFKTDITHWKDYDYTVINDKIEKCYKQIISFIANQSKNKKKLKYNMRPIKNHIKKLLN